MRTVVRVNGTGSAWPVMIGDKHPIYSSEKIEDLSNASYSIICFEGPEPKSGKIDWEVMIDMGHHTIPFLIKNENRIPEIVALTHGHADHFFGIDWIVQSYYTKYGIRKKYPVYTTKPVWESVLKTFGYLNQIAELIELFPGVKTSVEEIEGLTITAFPVYHGDSALGASMLLFENDTTDMKPVLFTGDLLTPLLRRRDILHLKKVSYLFIDSTNRYPCPGYNHTSFTRKMPLLDSPCNMLTDWLEKVSFSTLIKPHLSGSDENESKYFKEFLTDWKKPGDLIYCIIDFLKQIPAPMVNLVHYSGMEDRKFYNQEILNRHELKEWATKTAEEESIKNSEFCYPEVGQMFDLQLVNLLMRK